MTQGLYYYALVWKCDNTPLKQEIFVCYIGYVEDYLTKWYDERGIRIVCVGPVNEDVTESIII